MSRIVLPDGDPAMAAILAGPFAARVQALGGVDVHTDGTQPPAVMAERIAGHEVVLLGAFLPPEAIPPEVRLLSVMAAGVENYVDVADARARGIAVTNTPHYGDASVAEHALALLLAAARFVPQHDAAIRAGGWFGVPGQGMELTGKTIGLVGYGGIAQHFARIVGALGMDVVVWTRDPSKHVGAPVRFAPLKEVMGADVVSLHLMLTDETRGMIDDDLLALLPAGSILLNTARAELIAPGALRRRLAVGDVRAALDVYEAEPLDQDDWLRSAANVVLSPHQGYNTPEAVLRIVDIALSNIEDFLRAPR